MKKNLFVIALCIIIGLFMGTYMFNQYNKEETEQVSTVPVNENKTIIAFQYGVYSKKESIDTSLNHVYEVLDNQYYVYLGMTTSEKNKEKLNQYFKNKKITIYAKQIEVTKDFYDTLTQYDLLLTEAVSDESIQTILETVVQKFEEMALNDQNQRITY